MFKSQPPYESAPITEKGQFYVLLAGLKNILVFTPARGCIVESCPLRVELELSISL